VPNNQGADEITKLIEIRRTALNSISDNASSGPAGEAVPGKTDVWGLALSGGGIRSATFALGLISGLASKKLLRRFDLLSTVSGGGYIGSALGKLYNQQDNALKVEEQLGGTEHTWFMWWLRMTSRYLTPRGAKDLFNAAAVYARNLLAIHLELAVVCSLLGVLLGGVNLAVWYYGVWSFFISDCGRLERWGPVFQPWLPTLWVLIALPVLFSIPITTAYWFTLLRPAREVLDHACTSRPSNTGGESYPQLNQKCSDCKDREITGLGIAVAFSAAALIGVGGVLAWVWAPWKSSLGNFTWHIFIFGLGLVFILSGVGPIMKSVCRKGSAGDISAKQRKKLTDWLTWCLWGAVGLFILGIIDRMAWFIAFDHVNWQFSLVIALGVAAGRALVTQLSVHNPAIATSHRGLFRLAHFFGGGVAVYAVGRVLGVGGLPCGHEQFVRDLAQRRVAVGRYGLDIVHFCRIITTVHGSYMLERELLEFVVDVSVLSCAAHTQLLGGRQWQPF
jgi:hypothetical protein